MLGWSWPESLGHFDVCVAVIDGAVDLTHPCFVGANLAVIGDDTRAPTTHGTHTASVIFGQPGTAVHGLAPQCRGVLISAFRPLEPLGSLGCTQVELARAIVLALEHGAHVINIAGGQASQDEPPDPALIEAIERCERAGVLIVAAAGNDGDTHIPAAMPTVLAVARDAEVIGASVGGGTQSLRGTSCATALVSSLAARLLAIQRSADEPMDPLTVRRTILDDFSQLFEPEPERDRAMTNVDSNPDTPPCPAAPIQDPIAPSSDDPGRPWTGACRCRGSQLVYFIGELGFNFGRMTRLDSFAQRMPSGKSPHNPADVLEYLDRNPWAAASVIWTMGFDSIPMYAVAPLSFEEAGYLRLRQLLERQLSGEVARVAVPGLISGSVDLLCGGRVPMIVPDMRGITSWKRSHIHGGEGDQTETLNFLSRVFYELRSPGLSNDDRAINFAATEALTTHAIFKSAKDETLVLEKIAVDDSPICRPGSICRDVVITFFNPSRRFEQARKVFRLTVDVADTVPARIGEVRSWYIY